MRWFPSIQSYIYYNRSLIDLKDADFLISISWWVVIWDSLSAFNNHHWPSVISLHTSRNSCIYQGARPVMEYVMARIAACELLHGYSCHICTHLSIIRDHCSPQPIKWVFLPFYEKSYLGKYSLWHKLNLILKSGFYSKSNMLFIQISNFCSNLNLVFLSRYINDIKISQSIIHKNEFL